MNIADLVLIGLIVNKEIAQMMKCHSFNVTTWESDSLRKAGRRFNRDVLAGAPE